MNQNLQNILPQGDTFDPSNYQDLGAEYENPVTHDHTMTIPTSMPAPGY